ncbi:MAG: class I SAM-dependent rRNA methyltransferase [Gammaproteobacteria bacterium]|jgi:23S rRNA (cytosine1962-C5)-methyltransferase
MTEPNGAPELAPLQLKKHEERRIRAGHLWVYSNEVDTAATPLAVFRPGQQVQLLAHNGRRLGVAYVNPASLICARLVSRDPRRMLDRSLLVHRLNVALALRERLFDAPYYRLVYGEADQLPGLIVDRYGDVCVVQCTTAGMEAVKEQVLEALGKVVRPAGVVLRADSPVRALEGLEPYRETRGALPPQLSVEEQGLHFSVSLEQGQKTGWFYDQRMNRQRLRSYVAGGRVLDVFSYVGAWALHALAGGAREVLCVDTSGSALERVLANAEDNGFGGRVAARRGDAFEMLTELRSAGERFDVVVLDPPAFIKRRKDYKAGEAAYRRLNQLGMQVLARDGILVSASCSHHLAESQFQNLLLQGSRHLDRSLQVLERGHQAPDHPIHPAIAESSYLKTLFCRVLPA